MRHQDYDFFLPPQAIDIEQEVIGSLILDPDRIIHVREILRPRAEDKNGSVFYMKKHEEIYSVLLEMRDAGQMIDYKTVANFLETKGLLEKIGGWAYLACCGDSVPTPKAAKAYAEIVRQKYLERLRLRVVEEIKMMQRGNTDEDFLAKSADLMRENLRADEKQVGGLDLACNEILANIEASKINMGLVGDSWGLSAIDDLTGGMIGGNLYILGGRPGMGKTTLGLNIVDVYLNKTEKVPLVFSLEMSAAQLIGRLLCSRLNVDNKCFRTGDFDVMTEGIMRREVETIRSSRLIIDDKATLDARDVIDRAEQYADNKEVGFILVDYMQRLAVPDKYRGDKVSYLTDAANMFKSMARTINVPVMVLSQLSRRCEQRKNKRPVLPDLRESGGIEEAADAVAFLYRPWLYYPAKYPDDYCEFLLRKHRYGPPGGCKLRFNGATYKFENSHAGAIAEEEGAESEERFAGGEEEW
jgi:replicative DNA helicase